MRKLRSVEKKSNEKKIRISAAASCAGQFFERDGEPIDLQELLIRKLLPSAVKAFLPNLRLRYERCAGSATATATGLPDGVTKEVRYILAATRSLLSDRESEISQAIVK